MEESRLPSGAAASVPSGAVKIPKESGGLVGLPISYCANKDMIPVDSALSSYSSLVLVALSCIQLVATTWSPPGSSVHGIFQTGILERVAYPTVGHLPNPEIEPMSFASPALAGGFFTTSSTWEAPYILL